MKKITLLVILFCCGNLFAQQKVNFINGSSYDIFVSYVVTKDLNDEHPQLMSMNNGFIVPAGTTYSASDSSPSSPYRFPYNDFAGITQWLLSGVGAISSSDAYNRFGDTQKFYFAKIANNDNSLPIADAEILDQHSLLFWGLMSVSNIPKLLLIPTIQPQLSTIL